MDKREIVTLNEKINKTEKIMKFLLGMQCPTIFRHDDKYTTLIPRVTTTNIRVFTIHHVDMRMNTVTPRYNNTGYFQYGNRAMVNPATSDIEDINDNLHVAVCNGNMSRVQELVHKNKGLVKQKDLEGNIALHLAIEREHKDVCFYLIEKFPKGSYALNCNEMCPIYLGVVKGYKDLVEFMFQQLVGDSKAIDRLSEGRSIIFAALTAQNQDMVQIILRYQPKLIKSIDEQGWTPLSYAAYNGLIETVEFLLNTFSESILQKDSSYPIHKACLGGHVPILKMFYSRSPKLFTKQDRNGLTVLHHAAKEPHNRLKDVVSYLLSLQECKKLVKIKDETNRTPLAWAQFSQNGEIINLFGQTQIMGL